MEYDVTCPARQDHVIQGQPNAVIAPVHSLSFIVKSSSRMVSACRARQVPIRSDSHVKPVSERSRETGSTLIINQLNQSAQSRDR